MNTAQIKALFEQPDAWIRRRKCKDDAGNTIREFEHQDDPFLNRYVVTDTADAKVVAQVEINGSALPLTALKDSSRWWATGANPPPPTVGAGAPFAATCVSCGSNKGLCLAIEAPLDVDVDENSVNLRFAKDGSIEVNWDEYVSPKKWHRVTEKDVERIREFQEPGPCTHFTCDCVEDQTEATVVYADGTVDDRVTLNPPGDPASRLAARIIDGTVSLLPPTGAPGAAGKHVFCMGKNADGATWFAVTPMAHWKAEGCMDDQSLSGDDVAPFGLVEAMESVFEPSDENADPKAIRKALLAAGFVEDPAFDAFCKRSGTFDY